MPEYYFNPRTGRYHNRANNIFVKKTEVLDFLDRDIARTEGRMKDLARKLTNREISLASFENAMSEELKRQTIRASMLAAGGKNNMTRRGYGAVGNRIREELGFLRNLVSEIKAGNLTAERIAFRSGLYAKSAIANFSRSELIAREQQGVRVAKRFLDPAANHCPSCPAHQRSEWTPIREIVPVGFDCECRRNCRCEIIYFNGNLNRLSPSLRARIGA